MGYDMRGRGAIPKVLNICLFVGGCSILVVSATPPMRYRRCIDVTDYVQK